MSYLKNTEEWSNTESGSIHWVGVQVVVVLKVVAGKDLDATHDNQLLDQKHGVCCMLACLDKNDCRENYPCQ